MIRLADLEKVLKALEICSKGTDCEDECPYRNECREEQFADLAKDAFELLKGMKNVTENPCDNCQEFVCDGCEYAHT